MNDVSLTTYMKQNNFLAKIVFPTEAERHILADELLKALEFDNEHSDINTSKTADFFTQYIKELESRTEGK